MNEILLFETEFGTLQIEAATPTRNTRGRGELAEKAKQKFSDAVSVVKTVGNAVVGQIKEISEPPEEISVEIGIKFTAEAGAVIAKTSTEGTLTLNLVWKNNSKPNT